MPSGRVFFGFQYATLMWTKVSRMTLQREKEEKYTLCRICFPQLKGTLQDVVCVETVFKEKYGVLWYGTLCGVDYNLTLCRLQSRLQHIYHGQPYARVNINPMQESTSSPNQGLRILPQSTHVPQISHINIKSTSASRLMKETPRRGKKVTSSLNEISTDQLWKWVVVRGGGSYCALPYPCIQYKARICKRFRSPGTDSASLCSLAGGYDNPICPIGPPG